VHPLDKVTAGVVLVFRLVLVFVFVLVCEVLVLVAIEEPLVLSPGADSNIGRGALEHDPSAPSVGFCSTLPNLPGLGMFITPLPILP
jgi:hypothetical protein